MPAGEVHSVSNFGAAKQASRLVFFCDRVFEICRSRRRGWAARC